jgi:hypothetical protein
MVGSYFWAQVTVASGSCAWLAFSSAKPECLINDRACAKTIIGRTTNLGEPAGHATGEITRDRAELGLNCCVRETVLVVCNSSEQFADCWSDPGRSVLEESA